jgi:WD repeat-containing protein 19
MIRGDFVHALLNYERAMSSEVESVNQAEHKRICQSGIARSAVGSGDIRKGISLAVQSNDRVLMKQCAAILEDHKVFLFSLLYLVLRDLSIFTLEILYL